MLMLTPTSAAAGVTNAGATSAVVEIAAAAKITSRDRCFMKASCAASGPLDRYYVSSRVYVPRRSRHLRRHCRNSAFTNEAGTNENGAPQRPIPFDPSRDQRK